MNSKNQKITTFKNEISLFIKREDLLHPYVSGNKFRKLKYNLIEAKNQGKTTLLTFGGAFSNHIIAVAAAGKENGFKTIGIIRGEELKDQVDDNPTLAKAQEFGMIFDFISREEYRIKNNPDFIEKLTEKFGDFYFIPEGGTNDMAVKGCQEILTEKDDDFDFICCAVGTGGTISGLINSSKDCQKVLGFPALKGDFLQEDIRKFANKDNWELITDYHFGGYAKIDEKLIHFINDFYIKYNIPLDPIYTSKMTFGVIDLIEKEYFPPKSKILLIHTGGLQGVNGMNAVLRKKNITQINIDV
ncbi:1-aminocyclopropane-1-carboxylate deaminase/D-cysteine desulfhydrase [Flavobacterium sp. SE-s27]|uniref:1-aminocyclopropane-1-carboxylate deaminase/D-cysteine desulfhydrase n=1 Tax=Flavobacterium solisilvae TaxID=1852019 RepID=A0ABX1QTJ5_9FLAO|nr:pyridoxal-phosphate dependent enzyme [Flavobacterium solisilvae]NMH25594.1 1-aminocyclopropane-1-carboxylate deaminase/D-cysteine desulfhydrase [Flavobacterium solisilvae]